MCCKNIAQHQFRKHLDCSLFPIHIHFKHPNYLLEVLLVLTKLCLYFIFWHRNQLTNDKPKLELVNFKLF